AWLLAAGIGAGLMYFFDPQNGRRRRALLRDQTVHMRRLAREASRVTARDLAGRGAGMMALVSRRLNGGAQAASDSALIERIRARLGRVVSHPHAVHVTSRDGHVTVSGPILAVEAPRLLESIRGVAGVQTIDDQLQVHERAGNISALQGGVQRNGHRFELLQENWSPTARLMTGSAGLFLLGAALRSHGPASLALNLFGGGLLLRTATNRQLGSLAGVGAHCRDIEVQKSITIRAPIARVFDFWTRIRNFPSFMTRVREVQEIDDSRSYWRVEGPAGLPVEWTAEITRVVPQKSIEWRCDDRTAVKHSGRVRFEQDGENATRVHVQLHYFPPAGAVGHVVATLFGADPKSGLDADLMRMKSMLETGHPPHDAARPLGSQPPRRDADAG
ncbi:MAG: SRPBCC family protein, partial [Burkholderiales bacterium]